MSSGKASSKQTSFTESGTSPTGAIPCTVDLSFRGAFNISQAAHYAGVRCSAIEESIRDGRLQVGDSDATSSSSKVIWIRSSHRSKSSLFTPLHPS